MKKCPFCAEEIQDDAIKCRYCGEYLNGSKHTIDDPPIKKQLTEENRDRIDILPNKSYSMSRDQKRILVAVIVVFVAMIAYPPFHVIYKNGVVFNMGYDWIFDPPKVSSVQATVNVFMLLIQWIGVLVVGGIAFFLTKGASLTPVSSPQQNTAVKPPIGTPKDKVESLYETMLGEKNRAYYLAKFKEFDQQGPGVKAGWNWAAFFGGGTWGLYRKMYGWFFVYLGVTGLSGILLKTDSSGFSSIVFIALWIAFPICANSLYHRNIREKIATAQLTLKDEPKLFEYLRHKGGVHTWVIWVFTLLPVAGILAAIAIPNFIAYKQKGQNTVAVPELAESVPEQAFREKTGTALKAKKQMPVPNRIDSLVDDIYATDKSDNRRLIEEIYSEDEPGKTSKKRSRLDLATTSKSEPGKKGFKLVPVDYDPFAKETARDGRFIAYDNGTVSDTRTNLMWAAKDNGAGINWQDAKKYCENYRGGGYTDWRMPTLDELAGLYDTAKTYKSACGYDVHSTELIRLTCVPAWASETHGSAAAYFDFDDGGRFWSPRSGDPFNRALPVRSGK